MRKAQIGFIGAGRFISCNHLLTARDSKIMDIAAIADEIQKEANIESLITAKGFEDCIAVLNGDSASIIVRADDLQAAQVAQINAIVYEQAGIVPGGVTIIAK